MSEETKQGELYKKLDGLLDEWVEQGKDETGGYVNGEEITASNEGKKILDAARAEIPTRANAEKVLEERLGHKLEHDGLTVGMTACIHAELYGKWVDKWLGAP